MTNRSPHHSQRSGRRWERPVLLTLTIGFMTAATQLRPEWIGAVDNPFAAYILRHFVGHPIAAAMATLGLVSLSELLIRKILRLGEPVIGMTFLQWFFKAILFVVFYTFFGATALLAKKMGKDPLAEPPPSSDTYWRPREQRPITLEEMRKQ